MARGKRTCIILKEIRRQIADANGIDFVTSECRYKGDCNGTCPKCEAELSYIERELRARSLAGRAVSLAGISVASLSMLMPVANFAQVSLNSTDDIRQTYAEDANAIEISGMVYFDDTASDGSVSKEPLVGAIVLNKRTETGTCTDLDGRFKLNACIGDMLEISYIGSESQTISISEDTKEITITLVANDVLIGEVIAGMVSTPLQEACTLETQVQPVIPVQLDNHGIDYSSNFESMLSSANGQMTEDCTHLLREGSLRLDPKFFHSYKRWEERQIFEAPANGVIGNDFSRIEVFFYPEAVKIDSLTYSVKGRTKVKKKVHSLDGKITIKKIYRILGSDIDSLEDHYVVIADYILKEDDRQKDSGIYKGVFGAYGYIEESNPKVIRVDDRNDVADGYENRSFVGIWRSYDNPLSVSLCIWGDYRLPFTSDFDIGDGEMIVNPKYLTSEWEAFMHGENFVIKTNENGESYSYYKDPWW